MTLPVRSLRLQKYSTLQLDRFSYEDGEVFYDDVANTLRLMDGKLPGGYTIATEDWANRNLTTTLSGYASLTYTNTQLGLKADVASPTFTGTVTAPSILGNLQGNVNGNVTGTFQGTMTGSLNGTVTGNLVGNADTVTNGVYTNQSYSNPSWIGSLAGSKINGNIPGNAGTASALETARAINGTYFDGSSDISVPSLVNGSYHVTLGSDGVLGVSTAIGFSTVGSAKIEGNDIIVESISNNVGIRTNTNNNWVFDSAGDLSAPGDITSVGSVNSDSATITNTVTAGSAAVTNNMTVGGNVNIATTPTQATHATNKNYVDTRALAMSIAMS